MVLQPEPRECRLERARSLARASSTSIREPIARRRGGGARRHHAAWAQAYPRSFQPLRMIAQAAIVSVTVASSASSAACSIGTSLTPTIP